MSQQPSVTSWQTTVQRQVENGLPKGFTLLAAHQSKGSESLYFTVLKEGVVFDLRLSYHPNAHPVNGLIDFDLRAFPGKKSYHDFVALAFVEKVSQASGIYLVAQEHLLCALSIPPLLEATLLDQWARKWLLVRFRDGQLLLSYTGMALLEAYWKIADVFIDEPIWDDNPRIESPAELIHHFS
ncbi:hypothetical protein HCZ54_04680 [Limosilactobacillus fermentum]